MPLMVDEAGNVWDQSPSGSPVFVRGGEKAMGPTEDAVRSIPGVIPRAAAGLVGLPQTLLDLASIPVAKLAASRTGMSEADARKIVKPELPNIGEMSLQGWDKIAEMISGAPLHKPATPQGKVVSAILEGAASGAMGGGASKLPGIMAGAGAGAGGEIAPNVFGDSLPVRIGGSLLGGFAGGGATPAARFAASLFGGKSVSTPKIIAEHTRGLTDADWGAAKSLMADAEGAGVKLAAPQALPRVTPLLGLQEKLSQVAATNPESTSFLAAQTPATAAAGRGLASQISPQVPSPELIHKTGVETLKRGEAFRKSVTEPEYVFQRDRIFRPEADALTNDTAQAIATVGRKNPAGKFLQTHVLVPITGETKADRLLTTLLSAEGLLKNVDFMKTTGLDRMGAAQVRQGLEPLKNTLASISHNRPAGDLLHAQITDSMLKPQRAGLVGQVAGGSAEVKNLANLTERIGGLLSDETRINSQSILSGANQLAKTNPQAFPQLVRMTLEEKMAKAFKSAEGYTDPQAPGKFAAALYGSPEQTARRENFRAMMAGVAQSHGKNPQEVAEFVKGSERLMGIMEAAGRGKRGLSSSPGVAEGTAGQVIARGGIGMQPTLQLRDILGIAGLNRDKAYKEILHLFTSGPEGIDKIRKLAKWESSVPAVAKATGLVAGQQFQEGE